MRISTHPRIRWKKATLRRVFVAVIVAYIKLFGFLQEDEVFQHQMNASAIKEFPSSFIKAAATSSIHKYTNNASSFGSYYGRITFRLHELDDVNANPAGKYDPVPKHACKNSSILPSTLDRTEVLGFKISVSTDLSLIFIGDSVASQLAQAFDASVLDPQYDYSSSIKRHFDIGDGVKHICVTESTGRGGGVSAYMRHNFMMSNDSKRQNAVCGHGAQFWGENVAYSILDYEGKNVGSFDAAVLKIPAFGWIRNIHSITREIIIEEINLVGKYFGVKTVILSTITFNNNVKTWGDWEGIQKVNNIIRQIANSWVVPQPDSSTTPNAVSWVLVQELYNFTNQMIWTNARHIGYDVSLDFSRSDWDQEEEKVSFLFDRLAKTSSYFWPPSIPMVCGDKTNTINITDCPRNKISPDGMHWCTDTIGPRYSASIACLLGCVYNNDGYLVVIEDRLSNDTLRDCEEECNHRFMSVMPADADWISDDKILYARADK